MLVGTYGKIKLAYSTCNGGLDFVFHLGYQGIVLPVWFRKVLARSKIHRAWHSGFYGGGILGVIERTTSKQEELT